MYEEELHRDETRLCYSPTLSYRNSVAFGTVYTTARPLTSQSLSDSSDTFAECWIDFDSILLVLVTVTCRTRSTATTRMGHSHREAGQNGMRLIIKGEACQSSSAPWVEKWKIDVTH